MGETWEPGGQEPVVDGERMGQKQGKHGKDEIIVRTSVMCLDFFAHITAMGA